MRCWSVAVIRGDEPYLSGLEMRSKREVDEEGGGERSSPLSHSSSPFISSSSASLSFMIFTISCVAAPWPWRTLQWRKVSPFLSAAPTSRTDATLRSERRKRRT